MNMRSWRYTWGCAMVAISTGGWVAQAGIVAAPYANDFFSGADDFERQEPTRWSVSIGRLRFQDTAVDTTNVVDFATVTVTNLGGGAVTNFTVAVKFEISSASEAPAGSGERLGLGLVALADPALTSGYFAVVGAGEDIPGFEEGMAFYKDALFTNQTANFFIQGPRTDGSERWKLTLFGEYLPNNHLRLRFIAQNITAATSVTNEWTDQSGALRNGQTFGIVVAHTRYNSTIFFDDFFITAGQGDDTLFLPPGVRFRDEFDLPLSVSEWTLVGGHFPLWYGVTNGMCFLRAQAGEMGGPQNNHFNLVVRDLAPISTGDVCWTLAVAMFAPTNDHAQLAILVGDSADNFIRAAYGHLDGTRRIRLTEETDGVPVTRADEVRNFGTGPFWLRLTRQGGAYRVYWSTNGLWYHRVGGTATRNPTTPTWFGFWAGGDLTFVGMPPNVAWLDAIEVRDFPDVPRATKVSVSGSLGIEIRNLYVATTAAIERCQHLPAGTWTNVALWPVEADSTNWFDAVPPPGSGRFYRVRVQP